MRPDHLFTEAQIRRVRELMDRSHHPDKPVTEDERDERDALIEAEITASGARADALGL